MALVVIAAAACVAGCGGSGSPAGPTVSQYRAAANAACQSDHDALVALAAQVNGSAVGAKTVIPEVEAIDTHFLMTISSLNPPPKLASLHARLLRDILSQGGQPVTSKGPAATAKLVAKEGARSRRVIGDERALGLSVCVRLAHKRLPPINA